MKVTYFHNVTFVMLQKTLVTGNCVFLRVLCNGWVPLRSVTGFNELHNGVFNTLAETLR